MPYRSNAPLEAFFDAAPLLRSCRRITERVTEQIEDGARRRTPVAKTPPGLGLSQFSGLRGRSPGTLKASWKHSDVDEGVAPTGVPRFSAEAFTEDPIAEHVEWPTRPHLIRPRLDRAPATVASTGNPRRQGSDPQARLRYVDRTGRVRYAAEVHHPGTQGVHMMRDSLQEADGTWTARVGEAEVQAWAKEQTRLVR